MSPSGSISSARVGIALIHLGIAVTGFIRPHMTEFVNSYAAFGAIGSTLHWAWAASLIGLGLLLIPRGRPLLIIWQFASAAYFLLFSILITAGPNEFTWGSLTYGSLAVWSILLAFRTADDWFYATGLAVRARAWFTRRGKPGGG